MQLMKVLVCGGRDFENREMIDRVLTVLHHRERFTLLVHGAARGADRLAGDWAQKNGVDRCTFPANWDGRGKSAGHYRNGLMLTFIKPDLVVAFPGGAGTADMVDQAMRARVQVLLFRDAEHWTLTTGPLNLAA
jgi:hypothetical protein